MTKAATAAVSLTGSFIAEANVDAVDRASDLGELYLYLNTGSNYFWSGLRDGSYTANPYIDANVNAAGGASSVVVGASPSNCSMRLTRDGTNAVTAYVEQNGSTYTKTGTVAGTINSLRLTNAQYSGYAGLTAKWNYVRVRQYAATEPTFALDTESASGWAYRKRIPVTNTVASNLTGYQVKLTLNTSALVGAGKMQADCRDLRFTEPGGSAIPYWIEGGCNTASTVVWIKTDLAASATKNIYMYYGNAGAISGSDGSAVFNLFDDFASLDRAKWTVTGSPTISGGTLTANKNNELLSVAGFSNAYAIRTKINSQSAADADAGFVQWNGSATGASRSYRYSIYGSYPSANVVNAILNGGSTGTFLMGNDGTAAHVYDLARSGTQCQMFADDVSKGTLTGGDSGTEYVQLAGDGSKGTLGRIVADWILVRQYAGIEPSFIVDTEENSGSITMSHLAVTGTASMTAGGSQTITVTAVGSDGNTYVEYTGSKNVTFSGATASGANNPTCNDVALGTATPLTFTNGVATCTLKLYKAETAAVNAAEGGYSATGHTLGVTVSAAALSTFATTVPDGVWRHGFLHGHHSPGRVRQRRGTERSGHA
jgi:hypothetical protein